jgi:hypothetical protein
MMLPNAIHRRTDQTTRQQTTMSQNVDTHRVEQAPMNRVVVPTVTYDSDDDADDDVDVQGHILDQSSIAKDDDTTLASLLVIDSSFHLDTTGTSIQVLDDSLQHSTSPIQWQAPTPISVASMGGKPNHVPDNVIAKQSTNSVPPAGSGANTRHNLGHDGTKRAMMVLPQSSQRQGSRNLTRTTSHGGGGGGGGGSSTLYRGRHPMWGSSNPVMVAMDFDVKWEKRLLM